MKICFKCQQAKPITEFYKHPRMDDGHLGKCKECTKKDVTENRWKNVDKIRAYDRDRGNRQSPEYGKMYRESQPMKEKARRNVTNAVQGGKLSRGCCEICGVDSPVHGHHDDYNKPLDVRWLCVAHHKQWHVANGEGKF